jgi:para-nitrobenzyl esterase
MSDAWVRFAATGDPNGGSLPHWPRYTPAGRSIMLLDDQCRVADDPAAAARELMTPLLGV